MPPLDDAAADSADRVPPDAGVDLPLALQRLGNDRDLLRELALIYIQDAPGLLTRAADCTSVAESEEAARAAHSLKGLSANFSAPAADAAHAAESAIRSGDPVRIKRQLATLQLFVDRLTNELNRSVINPKTSN